MKIACIHPLSWFTLAAGLVMAVPVSAVDFYTSDTEEPEPKPNEISFRFNAPSIDEDDNAAQVAETLGIEDANQIGLQRFYYANDPDSDWRFIMDGRWLVQPEEIYLSVDVFKPESFYVNIDFQHWIDYDYGAGIYYPPTNTFAVLDPDLLSKKISKFKLTLRAIPGDSVEWDFGYSFFNRDGMSVSTIFGDDYQYVLGRTQSRGIIPALNDIKETVNTLELGVKSEDGITRSGARVFFQRRESERTRSVERAAQQPSRNRFTTDEQSSKDDLFGLSGYVRRELTDTLSGSVGASFTTLDGEVSGSRIFGSGPGASYDLEFAALQIDDRGFLDLDGMRKLKQWIFNANLVYEPEGNWRWTTGVRLERLDSEAFNSYLDTVYQIDWGDQRYERQEAVMSSENSKNSTDLSGFFEIRYKGFSKAMLYSRVEGATQEGSLDETWDRREVVPDDESMENLLSRATEFDRLRGTWETGVNYYPWTRVRLSLEGYLKYRKYDFGYEKLIMSPNDETRYPGYIENQTFYTRDVNARLHVKILPSLKSVTRIDLQDSSIDTQDRLHPEIESSDRERVVFNQSLTWTPHPRFFITAAYHLVDDMTKTPAPDIEGTFSGILVNLPNDYWQADLNLYCVISKLIDLELGYHYLEMSNYIDNSPLTVPYGSDLEQHQALAAVILHFGQFTVARIGYNYYQQTDAASAGLRDYDIHMITSSLQVQF